MFDEYLAKQRKGKIKADTLERWNNRILKRGLQNMGSRGAHQYLSDYGKGIGAAKCVQLALVCEREGYPDLAGPFWEKAFELETGQKVEAHPDGTQYAPMAASAGTLPVAPNLPAHLQPGKISTMQPIDAPMPRSYYIDSYDWVGQPKRDGHRMVVIVDGDVYYQSRSTKLKPAPCQELDKAFRECSIRPYVLDGELYYLDAFGKEHRSGAQAATANIDGGEPEGEVRTIYAIFKALYYRTDLTDSSEGMRISAGQTLGHVLNHPNIEVLPSYLSVSEKRELYADQVKHGREGEVWINLNARYVGGKTDLMVRTKHLSEDVFEVIGLTPSTARAFGAIEVIKDREVSLVGTGFSHAQMDEIVRRFREGRVFKIRVAHQGYTENGKLWLPRFVDFA